MFNTDVIVMVKVSRLRLNYTQTPIIINNVPMFCHRKYLSLQVLKLIYTIYL